MEKTGNLTEKSPCAFCGAQSVIIRDGHPVCPLHNHKSENKPHQDSIEKVASVLTEEK